MAEDPSREAYQAILRGGIVARALGVSVGLAVIGAGVKMLATVARGVGQIEFGAEVALTGLRTRAGLVIIPTEDHFTGGEVLARRTAERAGAQVALLTGLGHWWMCQDPQRGAAALRAFLA